MEAREIRISRAKATGLLWSDVVLEGDKFWPMDRSDTRALEKRLEEDGYRAVEVIPTRDRSMTIWRKHV